MHLASPLTQTRATTARNSLQNELFLFFRRTGNILLVKELQDAENDQTCDHDGSVRLTRACRQKLQGWYATEKRNVFEICNDGYFPSKRRQILVSSQQLCRGIPLSMVGYGGGFHLEGRKVCSKFLSKEFKLSFDPQQSARTSAVQKHDNDSPAGLVLFKASTAIREVVLSSSERSTVFFLHRIANQISDRMPH